MVCCAVEHRAMSDFTVLLLVVLDDVDTFELLLVEVVLRSFFVTDTLSAVDFSEMYLERYFYPRVGISLCTGS